MSDYRMVYPACTDGRTGEQPIHYCVEVDLEALGAMARKAARNKSQKSNDGPVRVTILNTGKAEFLKGGAKVLGQKCRCGHSVGLHSATGCNGHFSTGTLSRHGASEQCRCGGFEAS